jgi:hypothetical protein
MLLASSYQDAEAVAAVNRSMESARQLVEESPDEVRNLWILAACQIRALVIFGVLEGNDDAQERACRDLIDSLRRLSKITP